MTTSPARRRRACAGLAAVAPARRLAPRISTTSVDVSRFRWAAMPVARNARLWTVRQATWAGKRARAWSWAALL
jgi:hypothetical protein